METQSSSNDRLHLAEQILSVLKPLAHDTDLWHDSAWNTSEMLGPGTPFHALVLDEDVRHGAAEPYQRFLEKHWLAAAGKESDPTGYFVARDANPRWMVMRTRSRLAYLKALADFAQALDGLQIGLREDQSWTWDQAVKTSKGRPLHRTVYVLTIALEAKEAFSANKWLRTAGEHICTSPDERADRCLMQLMEEAGVKYGSSLSYSSTKSGFEVDCESVAIAESIRDRAFPDCVTELTATKSKSAPLPVSMRIAFAA